MNLLPHKVPNESNFHKAWNMILDFIRSNTIYSSNDISVNKSPNGVTLSLNKKGKQALEYPITDAYNPVIFGEASDSDYSTLLSNHRAKYSGSDSSYWDKDAGYKRGQIVRVFDSIDSNIEGLKVTKGTFVCVSDVPPLLTGDAKSFVEEKIDSTSGYEKLTWQRSLRRTDWTYYPITPAPKILDSYLDRTDLETVTKDNYRDNQGRFWEQIGAGGNTIEMRVCDDTDPRGYKIYKVFAEEVPSGSVET